MSRRHKETSVMDNKETATVTGVMDAFSNPLFRLGYNSQSPIEATDYPLTRMTNNYQLLNSLYRSNWVVQNVVQIIPDDMLREWFNVSGLTPEDSVSVERTLRTTRVRERLSDGLRWGRLYGGAGALILIKGQDGLLDKPLDLDSVLPGTFAGLYVFDRWSGIAPSSEIVTDMGDPDFGLPMYYQITDPDIGLNQKIHHSRIVRFVGRELPYIEKIAEQYWGESEIEALYEDVKKHDNVSANMAGLTFRANVDTMEVDNLDQIFALSPSEQQKRFWSVLQAQSVITSNFGTRVINRGDRMSTNQYTFAGLREVYESMCLDLSGAARIPVTKLFGRSPSGLNATGDADLQNYYDHVDSLRESKLRPALDKILPVVCMSTVGEVPDFDIIFPPLWSPTAREVAEIAKYKAETIVSAYQSGLLTVGNAQGELKKLEDETGLFGTISEEEAIKNREVTYRDATSLRDPMVGMEWGDEE